MFNIGDKVVYPMHGAGVIEAIEEQEVLGETRKYYIMRMPIGDMKVMIPINNVKEIGLRQIIQEDEVQKVLDILHDKKSTMSQNWNHRYRSNLEKIKSGDIYEVAEVVRNLVLREMEKGLSTGERKMLENARQILISELVLARGTEEEKIESMLDAVFA
ncbi:MAG: CarD family transcriptional regulator [Firmicutes bacterium HGW-Firmicutes-14]|jgi:CarD family transcriptional regulator|nr:MAG: CarD family transcriptional regulator [Firmicutes bacterium HGW-Firmicutes-14]